MSAMISVLVVEDEWLVRLEIASHLSAEGFDVHEASDADEAITILKTVPDIRLLFTDINMPGSMDGLKLSAAVRDRWPPIKIIVTSGHLSVKSSDLPEGARFFSKPYRQADVVRSMRELLAH
jgi:CheY-like chemotaxis protein